MLAYVDVVADNAGVIVNPKGEMKGEPFGAEMLLIVSLLSLV